jgi:hypothetical protein
VNPVGQSVWTTANPPGTVTRRRAALLKCWRLRRALAAAAPEHVENFMQRQAFRHTVATIALQAWQPKSAFSRAFTEAVMRPLSFPTAIIVLMVSSPWAVAQTNPSAAPQPGAPPAAATAPASRTAAAPSGKRQSCRQDQSGKGLSGQDLRDQVQLCVAQGQVDCLKQAIDQKVNGPQRRDFMRTCMGGSGRGDGSRGEDE